MDKLTAQEIVDYFNEHYTSKFTYYDIDIEAVRFRTSEDNRLVMIEVFADYTDAYNTVARYNPAKDKLDVIYSPVILRHPDILCRWWDILYFARAKCDSTEPKDVIDGILYVVACNIQDERRKMKKALKYINKVIKRD